MVLLLITFNPSDDSSSPLNNEILQSVPLIKIGVHELFHGFSREAVFLAFLIEFGLLRVDIIYKVPELAQRQCPIVSMGDR